MVVYKCPCLTLSDVINGQMPKSHWFLCMNSTYLQPYWLLQQTSEHTKPQSRRFSKVVFNLKLFIQTSHVKAVTSQIKLGTCEIRRLNWVMVTVFHYYYKQQQIRYDTYGIFYVPLNVAFNLPHYVTSYMHHTGKKKRE